MWMGAWWTSGGHRGTHELQQRVVLMAPGVLTAFCGALETLTRVTSLLLGFVCYLCEPPGEIRLYVKWEDWGFKFCLCHLICFTPDKLSRREPLYLSYGDDSCPPELAEVDQFT